MDSAVRHFPCTFKILSLIDLQGRKGFYKNIIKKKITRKDNGQTHAIPTSTARIQTLGLNRGIGLLWLERERKSWGKVLQGEANILQKK